MKAPSPKAKSHGELHEIESLLSIPIGFINLREMQRFFGSARLITHYVSFSKIVIQRGLPQATDPQTA